jgi:hypothetical protein
MKKLTLLAFSCAIAAASAGCIGFERESTLTGPSGSGIDGLVGNWTSSNIIPSPSTCTDFKWNVTEQTGNSARGSFSATCANELQLSGTAEGTLTGSIINWSATGTASAADIASCAISLTGTAELGVDSIRVPYSGDTCLGRVSGVETLRRR